MDQGSLIARIQTDPRLQGPFVAAQKRLEPTTTRTTGIELIALGVLYPVLLYILKKIGLPWINAAAELSNAELTRFHSWVQRRYKQYGFDPKKLEEAGDAMYDELCSIKSPVDRKLWEGVRDEALKIVSEDLEDG
jgi:hypothetical protein